MIISILQLYVLALILTRVIGLFLVAPLFSHRGINATARIGLIIWIGICIWFVIPVPIAKIPDNNVLIGIHLFQELTIGIMIGTVSQILFAGIRAAGEIMGMQMGLSVATAFNPAEGGQEGLLAKFLSNVMLLMFLVIDGHHLLLVTIRKSFDILPVTNSWNYVQGGSTLIDLAGSIFALGITFAAPIVLLIFLLDFSFGLVSRVAPQVNVFMLGFQLKPPLGEIGFLLISPLLLERMVYLLNRMVTELTQLVFTLKL
jgi:flagellar biosynthesis protein FliR